MGHVATQESLKPAELAPQQASQSTNTLSVDSNIHDIQAICQEALQEFRGEFEATCVAIYEATLAERDRASRELSSQQAALRQTEVELEELQQETSLIEQACAEALAGFRCQAEQTAAPLIEKGLLAAEEAEHRLQTAMTDLQARLGQARQENALRLEATVERHEANRQVAEQLSAKVVSLGARLAELQQLPAVARRLAVLEEMRCREREQAQAAVRFLKSAPWGELSRDRRVTPRLRQIEALARQDVTVFDALVERLSTELDRIDSVPPTVAWSVIRIVEQLGLQDLFPEFSGKKVQIARMAQAHKQEKRVHRRKELPGKVVPLASRWGARLTASR